MTKEELEDNTFRWIEQLALIMKERNTATQGNGQIGLKFNKTKYFRLRLTDKIS